MEKTKSKEDGAIIIEASIILPIFMFMFMTLYSVVNICFAEIKVQNALNNAARQICEYSYIYSFSGAKQKLDDNYEESDAIKKEVKENVIDNFSTVMDSINGVISGTESAYNSISADTGLNDLINSGKEIAGHTKTAITSGKQILAYFKGKSIKEIMASVIKVFSAELAEEAKRYLAEALAEWLCASDLDAEFLETIDFSKSVLFPNTSSDIILVAEYEVRVTPYIPVDLTYTISQQVVTRGWLDGDGGQITKNKGGGVSGQNLEVNNNIWTKNSINGRTEIIRDNKTEKLMKEGFFELKEKDFLNMYNPTTNTFVYIGGSNPLYGAEIQSSDDIKKVLEEKKEEIKQYLIGTAGRLETGVTSSVRYRTDNVDADGNHVSSNKKQYSSASPYEIEKAATGDNNEKKIKRKMCITVPEDPGVAEFYREVWNELPESQKAGIDLEIEAKYGKYFADDGEKTG